MMRKTLVALRVTKTVRPIVPRLGCFIQTSKILVFVFNCKTKIRYKTYLVLFEKLLYLIWDKKMP